MIPEVHACSGYLVITPKRAYRDNAGALCWSLIPIHVVRWAAACSESTYHLGGQIG
jgi:hypothetical protein